MRLHTLLFVAVFFTAYDVTAARDSVHPCDRDCEWPAKPRNCEYEFTVEWYYTMSKACYDCPYHMSNCSLPHCIPADGVPRPLVAVNRQFPGPSIRVCHNDNVTVVVHNHMDNEEGVAVHWHGLYMKESPHMDGVPMVTQCPIPAKTSFTYKFKANPPGTHWWHSHAGLQRADGFAGPLIIKRASQQEPHASLYDEDSLDHVVFVMDWLHQPTLTKFLAHHHSNGNNKGEGMLINGKGVFKEFHGADNATLTTPYEVFHVKQNRRYRFRTISNAAVFCPFELTIDGHLLNVIASDGADIEPYLVTSLVIHGGERFDFVLNATQNVSNYWLRVQGLADCRNQSQKAILRYEGASSADPETSRLSDQKPLQLNPWNVKEGENHTQVSTLKPVYSDEYPRDVRYEGQPDQTHFIGFDFMRKDNPLFNHPDYYPFNSLSRPNQLFSPQLNNISFKFPEYPFLTQSEYINDTDLCDPESASWDDRRSRFCEDDFCSCSYVVDVAVGNLVELVIYDEGRTFDAGHPMHLHGQHFAVVAMDKVGTSLSTEQMKEIHSNGSMTRDFNAVLKDTVIVPDGGYTVVRFIADNPGVWFFHCHLAFHSQIGMDMAFRVGSPKDWVKPPNDFPKCGTWPSHFTVQENTATFVCPRLLTILSLLIMQATIFN